MQAADMFEQFLNGGIFTWLILSSFAFGVLISIERFVALHRAKTDGRKLVEVLAASLESGGVNAAIAVCAARPGPLANVFHAGLLRSGRSLKDVEHALSTAGAIEMGMLEKNLIWLVSVVSVAPKLGFVGTVTGLIGTFDVIASSGNLSPTLIAGGIAHALRSTALGLLAAICIHIAHSYCVTKIDNIVADMEEFTEEFRDLLIEKRIIKS
jgi:biopolymer transport protein ExbB